MNNQLFGREFELLAYSKSGEGRRWLDIGLQFDILKTANSDPNTATFVIFNLSQDSRAWLETSAKSIALRAGYKGNAQTLFQGDLAGVSSHKSGTTWKTEIDCGDGQRALQSSVVQASITPGASPMALVDSFKKSMQGIDFSDGFSNAIKKATANQSGSVISGSARDELTALLKPAGFEWTIQDGVLEVVEIGKGAGGETLDLRHDTGLLATKKTDKGGVEVSALLSGSIRINRPIKVTSESHEINGFFIPKTVHHVGDTGGQDWQTIAECVPL